MTRGKRKPSHHRARLGRNVWRGFRLLALLERKPRKLAAVALANEMARIV